MNIKLSIAFLLLFTASLTAQTTHLVPSQYATIRAAVNAASDGDTVLIAPGVYAKNVTITGIGLTVRGTGGPSVTRIDAPTGVLIELFGSTGATGTTIEGISFSGVDSSGIRANPGGSDIVDLTVNDCVFDGAVGVEVVTSGTGQAGVVTSVTGCRFSTTAGPGVAPNSYQSPIYLLGQATIRDCTVVGSSGYGMAVVESGTVERWVFRDHLFAYGLASLTATWEQCLIVNNQQGPMGIISSLFDASPVAAITVSRCTVAWNKGFYGVLDSSYAGAFTLRDSIIQHNDGWSFGSGTGNGNSGVTSASFCNIQGLTPGTGIGNIDSDPMFLGPGEWHLRAGSPCRDAGDPAASGTPVGSHVLNRFRVDVPESSGATDGMDRPLSCYVRSGVEVDDARRRPVGAAVACCDDPCPVW